MESKHPAACGAWAVMRTKRAKPLAGFRLAPAQAGGRALTFLHPPPASAATPHVPPIRHTRPNSECSPMLLAVRGATIVSLGETQDLIGPADILVTNGVITAVGTLTDEQRATCDEIIDASGKLVLPGLVNAHLHSPASLSPGTVDDVSHP